MIWWSVMCVVSSWFLISTMGPEGTTDCNASCLIWMFWVCASLFFHAVCRESVKKSLTGECLWPKLVVVRNRWLSCIIDLYERWLFMMKLNNQWYNKCPLYILVTFRDENQKAWVSACVGAGCAAAAVPYTIWLRKKMFRWALSHSNCSGPIAGVCTRLNEATGYLLLTVF